MCDHSALSIRELRRLTGLSQQAFGAYFGIPYRSIQNWEGGQRACPEYLLELMAYKLKNEGMFREDQA
jgi:DNA-binding transcriptional regulator YiaG